MKLTLVPPDKTPAPSVAYRLYLLWEIPKTELAEAEIRVSDEARNVLAKLGWVPPNEDALAAVEKVRDLRDVQGQDGTWNASGYMRGLYNGLELALSILEGERDPRFRDGPSEQSA